MSLIPIIFPYLSHLSHAQLQRFSQRGSRRRAQHPPWPCGFSPHCWAPQQPVDGKIAAMTGRAAADKMPSAMAENGDVGGTCNRLLQSMVCDVYWWCWCY